MKQPRNIPSLRRRYQQFALGLIALLLLISLWSYLGLRDIQREANTNLHARFELLLATQSINSELLEAYRALDIFLLDPERQAVREGIYQAVERARVRSQSMLEHDWIKRYKLVARIQTLQGFLDTLRGHLDEIIAVRQDTLQQYPSMAIGNQTMNPARDQIDNAFIVAFNEMNTEGVLRRQPQLYVQFNTLRRLWMQMLSNFRLYLANRVGSFNEEALPVQERSIETLYAQIQEELARLAAHDAAGRMGFQTSIALEEISAGLTAWYRGFEQARAIHRGGEWRMDTRLLAQNIIPSIDQINALLLSLESAIGDKVNDDVTAYNKLANRHLLLLWFSTGIGILFIAVVIWSSNKLLFAPLAVIARALRAESSSRQALELPVSRSQETLQLVDAFSEMRQQVQQRQSELEYRALHDGLTSLPNRVLLMDHIQHDISLARRENTEVGLMVIDLDRFKEINDTLGHMVGDQLLIEVGNRFKGCVREMDTVARLGGDEFAILLPGTSMDATRSIAQKIIGTLEKPIMVNNMQLFISASIGITVFPQHGEDAKTLMQHADVAMYIAKQNQSGFAIYDPAEDQHSIRRLALLNDLRSAIENREFSLQFQPIVNIADGTVQACEALLRWHTRDHGEVSPELIIDLAEQSGLIGALTEWVVDEALAHTRRWLDDDLGIHMSVNLSMHNLREENFCARISAALAKHGVPSNFLTLEITESAMMFNPRQVIQVLNELDSMGIRLAIDDFGTGFSSLAYLKQLPVDELKIDKSFIMELASDSNDQAIVRATLNLAENLGLTVVAEGIEDKESLHMLAQMGCRLAQGYHFARPLKADEFERHVRQSRLKEKTA